MTVKFSDIVAAGAISASNKILGVQAGPTDVVYTFTTATAAIASIYGLPAALGTSVSTALGVNVGTAGSFVVNGGALGTPSSGVGTNLTGTASGLTAGNVSGTGVGSLTSLAIGGATIGTNALAVTGTGAISGRVFIGTNSPSADNTALLIGRALTGAVTAHAVTDETTINASSGVGYTSFDIIPVISGTFAYSHSRGVQWRTQYAGSGGGTLTELSGLWTGPAITANAVTAIYHINVNDVALSGSGSVTNQYGILINALSGGSNANYAIFVNGNNPIYSAGSIQIDGTALLGATTLSSTLSYGGVTLTNAVTGTGKMVLDTSPTFTTAITAPLVIGGTGTTSTLTFKTTSGVGTTNADMIFQVGNNGATEAIRILNSGNVGVNTAGPVEKVQVTGAIKFGGGTMTANTASTGGFDYSVAGVRIFSWGASGSTKGTFTWITRGADGTSVTPMTMDNTGNLVIATTTDASASSGSGALQIAGGASVAKRFWIPAITASAGLQTAVLCQSSGGEMIADSVACLASSERFKTILGDAEQGALGKIIRVPVHRWQYRREPDSIFPDNYYSEHIGPTAEEIEAIDSRLVGRDKEGNARSISTDQLLALAIQAIQEQQEQIEALNQRLSV